MKHLHSSLLAVALAMASWGAVPAVAQALADMTTGEVRKVDKDNGKLTLRHEEIKNLDMPPMTMVFTVKDPTMLTPLKAGDKVKFSAAREGGKIVVTDIRPSQ